MKSKEERNRERRETYRWYRDHGICPQCRKREVAIGLKACPECLERHANWLAQYRQADPEKIWAYQRALRKRRADEGRCWACGRPTGTDKRTCPACLAKKRRKWREQHVYSVKPDGICKWCDEPVAPGYKYCEAHLEQKRAAMLHARQFLGLEKHAWRRMDTAMFKEMKKGDGKT